uniref:Urotensin II-related peptide n=1 Tax=Oryzias sinensis TaxID=183150 RepID=A0A8C7YV95_9TELE
MTKRPASLLGIKIVLLALIILGTKVDSAPTDLDFGSPSALSAPVVPLRSSASSLSARPKDRLLNARKSGLGSAETPHKTAGRTVQDAFRAAGRPRVLRDAGNPDKLSKMLQMISALKEAQRTLNSTLSSHITFMPNANSRSPGRKTKDRVLPAAEGGVKPTTATLSAASSTASRASADISSMSGRNFRKSPQAKKTNKRVCFWKYCSQN